MREELDEERARRQQLERKERGAYTAMFLLQLGHRNVLIAIGVLWSPAKISDISSETCDMITIDRGKWHPC